MRFEGLPAAIFSASLFVGGVAVAAEAQPVSATTTPTTFESQPSPPPTTEPVPTTAATLVETTIPQTIAPQTSPTIATQEAPPSQLDSQPMPTTFARKPPTTTIPAPNTVTTEATHPLIASKTTSTTSSVFTTRGEVADNPMDSDLKWGGGAAAALTGLVLFGAYRDWKRRRPLR